MRRLWLYRKPVCAVLCLLVAVLIVAIVWATLMILTPSDLPQARYQCRFSLGGIGLGILGYCSTNKSFPPAYIADRDGQPAHSWRVLLLPFIERNDEYALYCFEEPWNSPKNRVAMWAVAFRSPFRCPLTALRDSTPSEYTDYLGIAGPGTVFQGSHPTRLEDMEDGLAATILAGETVDARIVWSRPVDLDVREMSFKVNDVIPTAIRSHHHGGAHVLYADGSVRFLSNSTDPAVVRAMTTIAGKEAP